MHIIFSTDDLLATARSDPRVEADQVSRRRNLISGAELCSRCGGTGNELLFAYRRCATCGGRGAGWEMTRWG